MSRCEITLVTHQYVKMGHMRCVQEKGWSGRASRQLGRLMNCQLLAICQRLPPCHSRRHSAEPPRYSVRAPLGPIHWGRPSVSHSAVAQRWSVLGRNAGPQFSMESPVRWFVLGAGVRRFLSVCFQERNVQREWQTGVGTRGGGSREGRVLEGENNGRGREKGVARRRDRRADGEEDRERKGRGALKMAGEERGQRTPVAQDQALLRQLRKEFTTG